MLLWPWLDLVVVGKGAQENPKESPENGEAGARKSIRSCGPEQIGWTYRRYEEFSTSPTTGTPLLSNHCLRAITRRGTRKANFQGKRHGRRYLFLIWRELWELSPRFHQSLQPARVVDAPKKFVTFSFEASSCVLKAMNIMHRFCFLPLHAPPSVSSPSCLLHYVAAFQSRRQDFLMMQKLTQGTKTVSFEKISKAMGFHI
jgi:hypothetical protein